MAKLTGRILAALSCVLVAAVTAAADAPRDLNEYVVLGVVDVAIEKGAFIAAGHVGANDASGRLELRRDVFMADGSAAVADECRLGGGTSVFDVFTNNLVPQGRPAVIRGTGPLPFEPPVLMTLPPLPRFVPGTTPVIVPSGVRTVLGPGAYGDAFVTDGGTLELTGGVYEFTNFRSGKSTKVLVDAPSTINIRGTLFIGRFGDLGPATSSVGARQIMVNVGGSFVAMGAAAHVAIDLLAPNARVRFGRAFRGAGRFIGREVTSDKVINLRQIRCGNGLVESGEQCDDGNPTACDGCSPECRVEVCGDGTVCPNQGEQCDDGNSNPCDGCTSCRTDVCGDGILCEQEGEECDPPADTASCSFCTDKCQRGPTCGNGTVERDCGEECDDGNAAACDGCTSCRVDRCGDGVLCPSEACDDGNATGCDGCTVCRADTCGDGTLCPSEGEECEPPGSATCDAQCRSLPLQFCTLRSEVYGASDGAANGPGGLVTSNPDILPVVVGAPGILSLKVQDQPRLVCFMPARGVPTALCANLGCSGDTVIDACGTPPILDFDPAGDGSSAGQGGGALTGEVIATKLNVALSNRGATPPGLANLLLPETLCTTKCRTGREIDPITMKRQASAAGIADGLTTVADLLALADQALSSRCHAGTCYGTMDTAFAPPDPIRIGSIENALRAVNECFEGCATIVPCAP